jgi:hypothetical protein
VFEIHGPSVFARLQFTLEKLPAAEAEARAGYTREVYTTPRRFNMMSMTAITIKV